MTTIAAALQAVRSRIACAARAAERDPAAITLLAVSKTFDSTRIEEAWHAGQRAFGESYVQEALQKKALLAHLPLEWHFIGPIQSNKTRSIAEEFDWVHGVEREKIARRLNDSRPAGMPPLEVCIQLNVSGEASKSGIAPGAEVALARVIMELPRLRLRGLMAIPEPVDDVTLQRSRFARVRDARDRIIAAGIPLDTLSMGMSDDLEAAIAEGATLVRIGTAIFGQRTP